MYKSQIQTTSETAMDRLEILDEIVNEHHLDPLDIFLLPLIPLIEVIWADGRAQQAEVDLLLDFTRKWLTLLKEDAAGEVVVSVGATQRFLERFLRQRPSPALLSRLREMALDLIATNSDPAQALSRERTILDYCIDIAAATVTSYPYGPHDRVMDQEKNLLLELMYSMQIDPENPA